MKTLIPIFFFLILTSSLIAQAPQSMSYQAIIRDADNQLLKNETVGMQISILQSSATGNAVYVETQTPLTNTNGLISIAIGTGTPVTGFFADIDWSAGPYFIKTETDPDGGTNYSISGTSQLLSVPYALYAENTNVPSRKRSIMITPSMMNSSWKSSDVKLGGVGGWIHTSMEIPEGGTHNITISIPIPSDYNGGGITAKALYTSTTNTGQFDCNIFARGSTIDANLDRGTGGGELLLDAPSKVNHLAIGTTQLGGIDPNPEVINLHFKRRSDSTADTSTGTLHLLGIILEYED